jgi:segregation and condensation protein B
MNKAVEEIAASANHPNQENLSLDEDFIEELSQKDESLSWKAETGLNEDSLCGAIEAIIFMNDKPCGLAQLKNQLGESIPLRMIHSSIARLQKEYEQGHHGIRLLEVADGYQFRTRPVFAPLIQKMFKVEALQLSQSALEVLAVIAYRQPIARSEIDRTRGVDSSHILRGLMDKKLVKLSKRSLDLGKMAQYATTNEFLELFGLNKIEDLPPEYEISALGSEDSLGSLSDIKSMFKNTSALELDHNEMDELEKLDNEIKSISYETDFIRSLKRDGNDKGASGEGSEKHSAFDLLEGHLLKLKIKEENLLAANAPSLSDITSSLFSTGNDLFKPALVNPIENIEEDFFETASDFENEVETDPLADDVPIKEEAYWMSEDLMDENALESDDVQELQELEEEEEYDSSIESLDFAVPHPRKEI